MNEIKEQVNGFSINWLQVRSARFVNPCRNNNRIFSPRHSESFPITINDRHNKQPQSTHTDQLHRADLHHFILFRNVTERFHQLRSARLEFPESANMLFRFNQIEKLNKKMKLLSSPYRSTEMVSGCVE